jgi:trk system potassium uptake protein TrkH
VRGTARARPAGRRPRIRAVDLRGALGLVGTQAKLLGLTALLPAAVAIGYGERWWNFVVAGTLVSGVGWGLERAGAGSRRVGVREAFLVVALTWLVAAAFGAIPYLLSGVDQIDRPLDAYFEAMSGFTTTGATVLTDVDALPRGLLFWRQLTQWLGGMGIIVLALAVLPRLRVGGRQLLESELPGPEVEPLTARIRQTAQRLWILYVGLTVLQALILAALGWTGVDDRMHVFNAVGHALATMPTGGFSPENRGVIEFAAATQWVIAIFMIVAGINFALLYRAIVRRQPRALPRDEELRLYIGLLAFGATVLAVELWTEGLDRGEAAVRHGVFQAASMMTTTGYASADFVEWPALMLMALIGLMFVGGSAGSTAGSVKVVRHLLLGKILRRELAQTVHPELVQPIRLNATVVDERTLRAVGSFVLLYVGIFVLGASLLAIDAARSNVELSVVDAIAATATTLGNVGPGLGFAGPLGSFEPFSDVSNVIMIGLMWLGRLELLPVVVLFTRSYWRN